MFSPTTEGVNNNNETKQQNKPKKLTPKNNEKHQKLKRGFPRASLRDITGRGGRNPSINITSPNTMNFGGNIFTPKWCNFTCFLMIFRTF
jgi:hypothetical protein